MLPALEPIADENGWRLETYTKANCPLVTTAIGGENLYEECYEWGEKGIAALTAGDGPDFVVMSGAYHDRYRGDAAAYRQGSIVDGYVGAWERLRDADVTFAFVLDTPRPRIDIPECVSANPASLTKCAVPRDEALKNGRIEQARAAAGFGLDPIDLTEMICPEQMCAPIIGNVLVYRDTNHLTATYSRSLSPEMAAGLASRGARVAR